MTLTTDGDLYQLCHGGQEGGGGGSVTHSSCYLHQRIEVQKKNKKMGKTKKRRERERGKKQQLNILCKKPTADKGSVTLRYIYIYKEAEPLTLPQNTVPAAFLIQTRDMHILPHENAKNTCNYLQITK